MAKKATPATKDMWSMLSQAETTLNVYFGQKAPQLPKGLKNFIVTITPYLTILGVILSLIAVVPLLLLAFGLSAMMMPFMYVDTVWNWGFMSVVTLVGMVLTLVLSIQAIPGLFKRQKMAWTKLFWVSLINLLTSAVSGNLIGAAIGAVINWYFLFQIRSLYR